MLLGAEPRVESDLIEGTERLGGVHLLSEEAKDPPKGEEVELATTLGVRLKEEVVELFVTHVLGITRQQRKLLPEGGDGDRHGIVGCSEDAKRGACLRHACLHSNLGREERTDHRIRLRWLKALLK